METHIHLPPNQCSTCKLGVDIADSAIGAQRYDGAFEDPRLGEIARAVASELQADISAGRLPIESLASSMAARLVQKYGNAPAARPAFPLTGKGLDRRRLVRVLDYIEANLEGDLALDTMASIACLSRCYFVRAFKLAVGRSPNRYVSARRLEHAKGLLIHGDRPLVDIALALGFSSQANFTRAFSETTGLAPGRYRQKFGSRQRGSAPTDIGQGLPVWRDAAGALPLPSSN